MKKFIVSIFLYLGFTISVFSQHAPASDQYVLNPFLINSSYAGSSGALNLATFYKKQWTGVIGAPQTLVFAADAPLPGKRIGLGLIIVSDQIGVSKETRFLSNYSYKVIFKNSALSFGLGAGLTSTQTAWSKLNAIDEGDDIFLIDSKVYVLPDFTFGVNYSYENFFAAFSIPRLLNFEFDYDINAYKVMDDLSLYTYMFSTGYMYNLTQNIKLMPSTLISFVKSRQPLYDINIFANYADRFWAGLSYRNDRSVAGLIQLNLNDQLKLGYSYDFDMGKLSRYSNGTHNIMLGYTFKYRVDVVSPVKL
jgi:type IX secretion system PorP/SprF family membrane protein